MSMRRISKRQQNGGNTSKSKKARYANQSYQESLFTTSLIKAGVTLSDGVLQNNIDLDVPEFQRVLLATLTSHHDDFNQVVIKFNKGLTEYIESYARFHKLLLSTIAAANVSGGSNIILPSIVRILLCINELQEGVAKIIIEKLLDFTTEEPVGEIDLDTRDVHQIPKLILNQLRWLDYLVNGKELCDKLLEVTNVLPCDLQRDIIQAIPHIIEDDQHGHVADKLKDTCNDNSDLLTTCIDTWSELNMSKELGAEVLDIVMERVSSAEVEDLPIVLNYIFTQKGILKNVVETIREVRERLDTDSCFIPLPTMTSTPHPNLMSQSACSSGGYVVLDCIQNSLQRMKLVATGWLKVIESIDEESDHKLLDLFVLFILHGLPNNSKPVRNLIINKVKSKKFTENILLQFFLNQIPNLRNLFPSVLSIGEHLLCSSSPTVSIFAQKLYKHAFTASDRFKKQDIIATQVSLISSGNTSESNYALEILEDLVETYPKEVERFTILIKNILDYIEYLDVDRIRKIYSILSMLAYTIDTDTDSSLHDELETIIRKQLHHTDETFRHSGVIAAVMAVKQITQQKTACDDTLSDVFDEGTTSSLSSKRKQQAEDILKQVFTIIEKNSNSIGALFFDEMANVVTTSKLHSDILKYIQEEITNFFQENYVIESTEELSNESGMKLSYSYSLEGTNEDGDIAINLLPCVIKYLNKEKQAGCTDSHRMDTLCSNFRLLRILEQTVNDGVSEIDALLGCPVVLPDPIVLEVDTFKDLTLEQRQIICASLFHCINWFRELLSAFASEKDLEMNGKILQRLGTITELQQTLNTCLIHTPGPIPSVIPDPGTKQLKKKSFSKSKMDVTLVTTAASMTATQLDNGAKDTTCVTQDKQPFQITVQSDSLLRLKSHFRELDLSAYKVLTYEPLSRAFLTTISQHKDEIKLEFHHLLFILQELYQKVSTQFSFFAAKKKTRNKELSQADRELASLMTSTVITALCNQLEAINTYFRVQAENNDGVLDCSIDSSNYRLMLTCFQLIFKTLTTFFNWPLLSDPSYQTILRKGLKCFSSRISQASTQENATLSLLTCKSFSYIERFTDMILSLIPAAAQCRLLVAIQKITKVTEVKTKTAEYCGKLLKRSWTEVDRSSTTQYNEAIEYIIKYYIEWSEDPLNTIECIYGDGITNLIDNEEPNNQSQVYPTLTLQSFPCYYRALSASVVNYIKTIPPINKESVPTPQALLEFFKSLQMIIKHYNVLVNLVKSFDIKSVIGTAMKNGRLFIDHFIKNGIPIVDLLFKLEKDEVLSMLRTLQQATRCLQHFCGHSKVLKDVTLTKHVPALKKCLEILIFRVKEVVINHNCSEAFWMGSLKNRDLQGQIIPSQISQSVSNNNNDEEEEMETEQDYDDCASVDGESATSETISSYNE